jgi:hypothetical protein
MMASLKEETKPEDSLTEASIDKSEIDPEIQKTLDKIGMSAEVIDKAAMTKAGRLVVYSSFGSLTKKDAKVLAGHGKFHGIHVSELRGEPFLVLVFNTK